jgi:MFS family permease
VKSYFNLLRERRRFRLMWLASVVSLTGDWFNTIASVIIISRYTSSGLAIGGLFIARTLPQFLVGPIAGVVADRLNRKTVMVMSDILRSAIVLSFLFIDRPERLWLIYVLTSAQFMTAAFFQPASSALIPNLLRKDELVSGNVINSITWSAMLALGAALGGAVAALFGTQTALIIDAGTYLLSAFLVAQIRLAPKTLSKESTTTGWGDMLAGFRYVLANPHTGFLALVKGMGQIGTGDIIIAIYAERLFVLGPGGATSLGLLYTAAGLGAIVGPFVGRRLGEENAMGLRKIIRGGFVIVPIGWLVMGLAPSLWLAMIGIFLRLMGTVINWTFSNVLLQKEVPDRYLGRVFAIDFAIFTLVSAVSIWLAGWLLDTLYSNPRQLAYTFSVGSLVSLVIWELYLRRYNA